MTEPAPTHTRTLERLCALDTGAVSDALDRLGHTGVAIGLHSLTGHHRISGRAVTVRLVGHDEVPPATRHLGTSAIEAAAPGDVIVVDHAGRSEVAGWGGLLSLAAARRGVSGVIVDGAVRDVDEARDLDFPMFARTSVPTTARGRVGELATNVPVEICGLRVEPGDFVVADGSGVVFVDCNEVEAVLDAAELIAARERLIADAIRLGTPITEAMGVQYERLIEREEHA